MSNNALKEQFSHFLTPPELLQTPLGVQTGLDVFDNFLLWKGFPKGDLTLLHGKPGSGATSLWMQATRQVHNENKWVAWINSAWELMPNSLITKKIDLKKLLVVKKPDSSNKMFWILQELISSSLFEMIGCHLPETLLKNHQLMKLKKLARQYHVALVIISHAQQWAVNPLFSLIVDCARDFFTIRRALHRPTPFSIQGNIIHADFSSQLSKPYRAITL